MTRSDLQRDLGRGPLGSAGTASSPDSHHIPTRTPWVIGVNDYTAAINKDSVISNHSQIPYGVNFTVEERSCILRYRKRWKDLLEGRWDQVFYAGYSAIFKSISEILYPEKKPNQVVSDSPIMIIDRAYTKLCQYEYNLINPELKKSFEDQSKANKVDPPWLYYRLLRSGYVQQGITYPYEAINSIDPNFKFLGKPVWKGLHKDFSKLLSKVEKRITKAGLDDKIVSGFKIKHLGGFVPRFIAGSKTISKHSIGLAIDLEYPTNPHLKGNVARAIDAILDHLNKDDKRVSGRVRKNFKGYGEMSMQDFDRLKEISDYIGSK